MESLDHIITRTDSYPFILAAQYRKPEILKLTKFLGRNPYLLSYTRISQNFMESEGSSP
jgi:hypothetical protein